MGLNSGTVNDVLPIMLQFVKQGVTGIPQIDLVIQGSNIHKTLLPRTSPINSVSDGFTDLIIH